MDHFDIILIQNDARMVRFILLLQFGLKITRKYFANINEEIN